MMKPSIRFVLAGLLPLCACAAATETPDTVPAAYVGGKAARIAQGGTVDTALPFTKFWDQPFTLTAWINPEFTSSTYGAVFASTVDTSFWFGAGDYRDGHGGFKDVGPPVLTLKVDDKFYNYEAPMLARRSWNHVALVRTEPDDDWGLVRFQVYVNGQKLSPLVYYTDAYGDTNIVEGVEVDDVGVNPDHLTFLSGELRLGRSATGRQWYGLIDDVRVYAEALQVGQVAAVILGGGDLPEPLAAYTFDEGGEGSAPTAGYSVAAPAVRVPIDTVDDGAVFDDPAYVSPTQVDHVLPFPVGEVWKVSQEFDVPGGSHNGYAAWCWDFVKVGGTAYEEVTATADGQVALVLEDHVPTGDPGDERESNKVWIRHTDDEVTSFLHLQADSFSEQFLGGQPPLIYPDPAHDPTWMDAHVGEAVGTVGKFAKHLHFGMRPGLSVSVTAPMAFVDYEVSEDGVHWTAVSRGMPRVGQFVRH